MYGGEVFRSKPTHSLTPGICCCLYGQRRPRLRRIALTEMKIVLEIPAMTIVSPA